MHEDYEASVSKILDMEVIPEVSPQSLLEYRNYLLQHLDREEVLTGREDFPWEEKYLLCSGFEEEYEYLKRTNPSYTDKYKLIDFLPAFSHRKDLVAEVKRLSDDKVFKIGLSWLTTVGKKSESYRILDDFASWIVN